MKLILVLLFALFLNACATAPPGGGGGATKAGDQMQKYGEIVSYAGGQELKFPDFSVKFLGRREAKVSNDVLLPQKMTFYDFEVARGEIRKNISWSSGMGDIAPTIFEIHGANYALELARSDVVKSSLGEGNLVIRKIADYDEGRK